MKFLNIGSLNLDYVYNVNHMVQPGETLAAEKMAVFCGGKGLNQSIALAKAGAKVYHAGMIGEDGQMLRQVMEEAGVDCSYVKIASGKTGHAIIQVEPSGQNCILLYGGANRLLTSEFIDTVLADFHEQDTLVLQNEVNCLSEIVDKAYSRGMRIVLNPSPFDDGLKDVDFSKISTLILNEVEGEQMTGKADPAEAVRQLCDCFPEMEIIMTLGEEGAVYRSGKQSCRTDAVPVETVDTTAAGDTFTGYFLTAQAEEKRPEEALKLAAKAAAIAVTRQGASPSIPLREEVNAWK